MPFIIPTDWDGVSYRTHLVEFPESNEWLSLLAGAITEFSHTYVWEGNDEEKAAAAAVGRDIITQNSAGEILPQVYTPINPPQKYICAITPIGSIVNKPVPNGSRVYIGQSNSYEVPSQKVYAYARVNLVFSCTTSAVITCYIQEVNGGQDVLAANLTFDAGTRWLGLSMQNRMTGFYPPGGLANFLLAVQAYQNNTTVTFTNSQLVNPYVVMEHSINDEFITFV